MCGIAGVAGIGADDVESLGRMAGAMVHRGPDEQGIWTDGRVGLAFRRLAIIDLDERSNQPQHLGPLHLVFNGEIYNYVELRDELRNLGHAFTTEGDCEVLLHAWAEWGERALDRANGMFAIALWDESDDCLTLAVDRFAEKPLFFHERPGRLVFGSDVRALRAADRSIGVPDHEAVDRFTALAVMPVLPRTFFADVRRLPGSFIARWDGQRLSLRRWWEPSRVEVPTEPQEAASQLRALLTDSVAIRLRSDVAVGTSLSGGVDSSAIAALSAELGPDVNRHAFTATFSGFERDEWRFASTVAEAVPNLQHHAVRPDSTGLLEDLQQLVIAQEEPVGGTSIYAQWCVMRAARETGVTVMLDGQGADEMFGGYRVTRGWALRSMGALPALRGLRAERDVMESLAIAYVSRLAPKQVAVRYRLRMASPYVDDARALAAARWEPPPADWREDGSALRHELLMQAFRTTLPQLCRYADRDSMAFGVEVRLPFLDHRIVEFGLSAAPGLLYREGVTKRVLRDAVRGLVPDVVLDRRDKVGYETPESVWLRQPEMRDRVASVLLDPGSNTGILQSEVERDLAQERWRDANAIWRALNVELWLHS
jgi:asparagine synthase (glutamine-hydrolysing)